MYSLLRELEPRIPLASMKESLYKFHRGSEWLEVPTVDIIGCDAIKVYHNKSYLCIDYFVYCSEIDNFKEINKKSYLVTDNDIVLKYERYPMTISKESGVCVHE